MARKPTPAPEVLDAPVNPVALAEASNALAVVSEQALQLQATFGLDSLDPTTLAHEIGGLIQQTGRALFAMGGRLCALRAILPKEDWHAALDRLGFSPRVAARMMNSALKCVGADGQGRERLMALPQSKVLELVTLDESSLDELEQTGAIGQLALEFDEIDRMSSSELRKKIRELEQSNTAKDKVISKKSAEIDKLHIDAARVSGEDSEAITAQAQITALRDATTAAEQGLLGLANAIADALDQSAQEHVATAARTSAEYVAQFLADLINRHAIPVQFEEMVTPDWMTAPAKQKKRA